MSHRQPGKDGTDGVMRLADHLRDMRILVVDDVRVNVAVLDEILRSSGLRDIETTTSATDALATIAERAPDLLLLDLHMPEMSGFDLMDALGADIHSGQGPVVLVLTSDITAEARRRALAAGAKDFVSKPFDFDEVLLRVRNLLETRYAQLELAAHNMRLESIVAARTAELRASRLEVLDRLALVAEFRDDETERHAQRIGRSAVAMAQTLDLPADTVALLGRAAALHDIGKIAVADSILRKPGRLTPAEFAAMQRHTTTGARILAGSRAPVLQLAQEIALTHHERWDGSGYPQGLAGDAIPITGRVVAVADVFDALTHERPYKPAWEVAAAVAEIGAGAGSQFDPSIVAAFATLEPAELVDPAAPDVTDSAP
jgi:response regulator RpfG family c-di-GMP phosphodiesterase